MATFQIPIKVGKYAPAIGDASDCAHLTPALAVVDRDAGFSMFPKPFLNALGIEPRQKQRFADGSEYEVGTALLEIEGEQWPCPIIFGPDGRCVLGRTALSAFGLQVDSEGAGLEPAVLHLPTLIAVAGPAEVAEDVQ